MPDSPTIPDVLYRYQALNANSITNLVNRTVWFADPRTFNDPFDCQLQLLMDPDRPTDEIPRVGHAIEDKLRSDPEIRRQLVRGLTDMIEHAGVVCLSKMRDQTLMWSHYADEHRGFCMGFQPNGLGRSATSRVEYCARESVLDLDRFKGSIGHIVGQVLCTKVSEWSYEQEWRLIYRIEQESERARPWSEFMTLTAIYLGLKMPEQQKQTIRTIFKDDPDVTIHEMAQVPGQLAVRPKVVEGTS